MDSFLVLGHGVEDPIEFEERKKIPKGIVLVIIAECGIITTKEDVCPMVEAFTNPEYKEIFADPMLHKKKIQGFLNGKEIHIYKEGKLYPQLMLQMFLDWDLTSHVQIFKSGLYRFPLTKADFELSKQETFCESLFKQIGPYKGMYDVLPNDFNPTDMFKGSIAPTVEEVNLLLDRVKNRSVALKEELLVPLETLFAKGGPGVYYYVVCRHPKNVRTPRNLVNANVGLSAETYKPYSTPNWISKLNTLLPLLEQNRQTKKMSPWQANLVNTAIRNYKRLQRVPLIRSKSTNQQEGGKGYTKKRKAKRSRTRKQRQ